MAYALADVALNTTTIKQITNLQHSTSATMVGVKGSGGIVPVAQMQTDASPRSTITTTDTTVIGITDILDNGLHTTAGATVVPFNKRSTGGKFDSGSVHGALSCDKSLAVPTTITCNGSSLCEIGLEIHYYGDDRDTNPVTKLSSRALALGGFNETCQFGKAYIKGVEVPEVTGATVNLGFTVTRDEFGGYPTLIFITGQEATFEFQTEDLDRAMSAIESDDTSGSGGTILYLAKHTTGATMDAFTSTSHRSITGLKGSQITETISAQEGQNGSGTIKVALKHETGGTLLTAASGVAIP